MEDHMKEKLEHPIYPKVREKMLTRLTVMSGASSCKGECSEDSSSHCVPR